MKSNKTLLLDGNMVIEGTPTASGRLLVAAGCEISEADMKKYDLTPADLGIEGAPEQPSSAGSKPASDFKALSQRPIAPEVKSGGEVETGLHVIIEKPEEKTIGSKTKKTK